MEEYDLVIVGAGLYGIPVAKTYLEVNPSSKILVLDAGQSVGGTWSSERLYEHLYSNNLVGMLEYSDFPMDLETFGVAPGSHVPGFVLHRYLTAYAEHFGVFSRIRFGATVKTTELQENGSWLIHYELKNGQEKAKEMTLLGNKLVLATGTTSEPMIPLIKGSEIFRGHIFHFKDVPNRTDDIGTAKNIVVLGGSKSAADAVYMNACNGRHVDWVIRASGKGPAWLSTPYTSPLQLDSDKLASTRIMTFLGPALDLDAYPTIRRLFQNTAFGRAFIRGFLALGQSDVISRGRFNDHEETKKLIPPSSSFWSGTLVGMFNYPTDFFGLIRQGLVDVHIADIEILSENTVHLSDGKDIEADLLICATGWKMTPTISFLPSKISDKMGISVAAPSDPTVQAADAEIMKRWPLLKDQPPGGPIALKERERPSWALYRGLVPPAFLQSRNLAYCGMGATLRSMLTAQTQALWITAFLDGKLSTTLPSEEEASWDAMLQNRFFRWRAPNGHGPKCPDMIFEMMPYIDTLMRDLGLNPARKGGWRELFESYGVQDYSGLVKEWVEAHGKNVLG